MYKVKKRQVKKEKPPVLYNILENYTDHDPPGNVMVCAMTGEENLLMHTQVLSESYDIPLEKVEQLLREGGVYLYPEEGMLVTKGAFVCRVDSTGKEPTQTWVMDVEQYAAAERLRQSYGLTLEEAMGRVFYRGLPQELQIFFLSQSLGFTVLPRIESRDRWLAIDDLACQHASIF